MNIQTLYKFSGYLSVIIGAVATMCMYRIHYLYYAVGLSIIGFIFSGINIFLNAKYFNEREKYPKGYFGMLLSSLPVLFIMLVVFKFKR
jgi:hypothetical protein